MAILVSLLAISAVSANDFNTTDEVIGEKIAIDDTNQIELASDEANEVLGMEPIPELQNLIDNSKNGDVIKLTRDYNVDYGYVAVNKSVTLDGNNHKINANNNHIFLNVLSDSVTLKNIQFVNWGDYNNNEPVAYLGVFASGVTISDCKFINCSSDVKSIICSEGNDLTIDSCQFNGCNVLNNAVVYSKGSNFKITNTEFNNNNNYYGIREHRESDYDSNIYDSISDAGALYIDGDDAFVGNCKFMYNTGYVAGAIIVAGDRGYVKDCSFSNNKARHMEFYDYVQRDNAGKVVKEVRYVYTAGAIKWDGDDGIFENPILMLNNQGYSQVNVFGKNYKLVQPVKLEAHDVAKYNGGSEKYTVTLTNNEVALANVNVKVSIDGKSQTVTTDSKGQASVNLNLGVGTHDVVAEYDNAKVTSKVTVKSTITANDASGTYSNSKVTATFLNTDGKALASKQVTFKINGKDYTANTNANGVATASIPLAADTYTVTAVNPVNNEQKQFKLTISKADSKIALVSSQNNGFVTLTATLTPAAATGNVVFNINGKDMNAAVKNGKATFTLFDLEPGIYSATATYNGDSNLKSSTSGPVIFPVEDVYLILTANDLTKTYGTGNKLVVNLVDNKGNAIADAVVNVNINSKITPITTDSNGEATMPINLKPGTYTAAATYADVQDTAKVVVKKATPKITAAKKTYKVSVKTKKYTITLKANGKALKSKKVYLKINKKTFTAKTGANGKATFKITNLKKKGTFSATISFNANSYYNKATKTVKITAKK